MRRMVITLTVAVVCAVLAAYLVVDYVRKQEEAAKANRIEIQPVVVATNDLPVGTRLSSAHLTVRPWPRAGLPEGAVSDSRVVVGRLVKGDISRAEPILEHRLFPKDVTETRGVLSVLVPPGRRAMTVGVNEVIGVSGFILPKNRVDVIATRSDKAMNKSSTTILQNVEVLAVGQRLEQKGEQSIQVPTVTMAVTPEEAEGLALSLNDGKIHIVLRSITDNQVTSRASPPPVRASQARPLVPPKPVAAAPSPKPAPPVAVAVPTSPRKEPAKTEPDRTFTVEVIRGDKRAVESYAHPDE